jgi:NTP pyrophosphatase (non-canonical NTP hydrolase)
MTQDTINNVRQWGIDKGIIGDDGKATETSQLSKLLEEAAELVHAIEINDEAEKIDAIGDCTVVLILLSEIIGTPFEACLESAYNVISKRTGKMVNGQFLKDK